MERQEYFKAILMGVIILLYGLPASGQHPDFSQRRKMVYDAYVSGSIQEWVPVMEFLEDMDSPDLHEKLELLSYYYGYTGYLLGSKNHQTAKTYIEKGNKLADKILKQDSKNATALALKGSFISFKIALSKFKAIGLGPESMKFINQAYKTDSLNVQALTDKGNMLFYAPGIFGGNKKQALTYFERAVKRMEEKDETTENWFYLNVMALLAQYYKDTGLDEKSKNMYEKIWVVEPGFQWAKEEGTTGN